MTLTLMPAARRWLVLVSLALLLAGVLAVWQVNRPAGGATPAAAAGVQMFMNVVGAKTKQFPGDAVGKNHANDTVLLSYSYELTSPRDAASGLPTGRRIHKPVTVTKMLGSNSPLFLNAESTNETLTSVTINFWKPQQATGVGTSVNYYRVVLNNASISDIKQASTSGEVTEEYQFTFQKITQTDLVHNHVWTDNWIQVT